MVTVRVPNFCTISQVCKELGFTYYTVSYWLDNNLVKWVPARSKRLINMEDLDRFLNGEKEGNNAKIKQSEDRMEAPSPIP